MRRARLSTLTIVLLLIALGVVVLIVDLVGRLFSG
jgi:hypothetical protein